MTSSTCAGEAAQSSSGKPSVVEQLSLRLGELWRHIGEPHAHTSREAHALGNRVPVAVRAVARKLLDGMGQGVAVVQALAHAAALRFVLRHHVGLEHHAAGDGLGHDVGIDDATMADAWSEQPEEELVASR